MILQLDLFEENRKKMIERVTKAHYEKRFN